MPNSIFNFDHENKHETVALYIYHIAHFLVVSNKQAQLEVRSFIFSYESNVRISEHANLCALSGQLINSGLGADR